MLGTDSPAESPLMTMGAATVGGTALLTLAGTGSEKLASWLPVEAAVLVSADPRCEDAFELPSGAVRGLQG